MDGEPQVLLLTDQELPDCCMMYESAVIPCIYLLSYAQVAAPDCAGNLDSMPLWRSLQQLDSECILTLRIHYVAEDFGAFTVFSVELYQVQCVWRR